MRNERANDPLTRIIRIPCTEWMRGGQAQTDYAIRYTSTIMLQTTLLRGNTPVQILNKDHAQ